MIRNETVTALADRGWFRDAGSYVLVDGQYGSTGKGLMADVLAQYAHASGNWPTIVTTNAGPNSGHCARMDDGTTIMTQQLPVFSAVAARLYARHVVTHLNGGAVLDMGQVQQESTQFGVAPLIHSAAALIHPRVSHQFNTGSLDAIASTGKGVGQAMAAKVLRQPATVGTMTERVYNDDTRTRAVDFDGVCVYSGVPCYDGETVFVETAQGFSLGINSGFYPYTTSRECSVPQALADAGLSHRTVRNVVMCVRTFPIRVGNTTLGRSGPCYDDQVEIEWSDIGVEPELTTVTKRIRRLFTWSNLQFEQALRVNAPDTILCNFFQYLPASERHSFVCNLHDVYRRVTGERLPLLLLGYGPKAGDVEVAQ